MVLTEATGDVELVPWDGRELTSDFWYSLNLCAQYLAWLCLAPFGLIDEILIRDSFVPPLRGFGGQQQSQMPRYTTVQSHNGTLRLFVYAHILSC